MDCIKDAHTRVSTTHAMLETFSQQMRGGRPRVERPVELLLWKPQRTNKRDQAIAFLTEKLRVAEDRTWVPKPKKSWVDSRSHLRNNIPFRPKLM